MVVKCEKKAFQNHVISVYEHVEELDGEIVNALPVLQIWNHVFTVF